MMDEFAAYPSDVRARLLTLCTKYNLSSEQLLAKYDALCLHFYQRQQYKPPAQQQLWPRQPGDSQLDALEAHLKEKSTAVAFSAVNKSIVSSLHATAISSVKRSSHSNALNLNNNTAAIDDDFNEIVTTKNEIPHAHKNEQKLKQSPKREANNLVASSPISGPHRSKSLKEESFFDMRTPENQKWIFTPVSSSTDCIGRFKSPSRLSPVPLDPELLVDSDTSNQMQTMQMLKSTSSSASDGMNQSVYVHNIHLLEATNPVPFPVDIVDIAATKLTKELFRYMYATEQDIRATIADRITEISNCIASGAAFKKLAREIIETEQQHLKHPNNATRIGVETLKIASSIESQHAVSTIPADINGNKNVQHDQASLTSSLLQLQDVESLSESAIQPVTTRSQAPIFVSGHIVSQDDDPLTENILRLEGDALTSAGKSVTLRVNSIPEYSIFPGQVLIARGVNYTGNAFLADSLIDDAKLPRYTLPKEKLLSYIEQSKIRQIAQPLSILVLEGPYTCSFRLDYQPFIDFLRLETLQPPHIVILLGPFLDASHPEASYHHANGDASNRPFSGQLHDSYFSSLVSSFAAAVPQTTKLVLIPSLRDLTNVPVFPQPPYDLGKVDNRVVLLPNPTTFRVNDVTFGVTCSNCLQELDASEISKPASDDTETRRFSRLITHLVKQQSYFPVFPSASAVDWSKRVAFSMPCTPDIMIVPSPTAKAFVHESERILYLGTNSFQKGSYQHLTIHPMQEFEVDLVAKHSDHDTHTRTRVDIMHKH